MGFDSLPNVLIRPDDSPTGAEATLIRRLADVRPAYDVRDTMYRIVDAIKAAGWEQVEEKIRAGESRFLGMFHEWDVIAQGERYLAAIYLWDPSRSGRADGRIDFRRLEGGDVALSFQLIGLPARGVPTGIFRPKRP